MQNKESLSDTKTMETVKSLLKPRSSSNGRGKEGESKVARGEKALSDTETIESVIKLLKSRLKDIKRSKDDKNEFVQGEKFAYEQCLECAKCWIGYEKQAKESKNATH